MKRSRIWLVVAGKEIRELRRDLRSLVLGILVPLVMFPLLFLSLEAPLSRQVESTTSSLVIGYIEGVDRDRLAALTESGSPVRRVLRVEDRSALERGRVTLVVDAEGVLWFNPLSETSLSAAGRIQSWMDRRAAAGEPGGAGAPPAPGSVPGGAGEPGGTGAPPAPERAARGARPPGIATPGPPQPDRERPAGADLAAVLPLLLFLSALVSLLPAALDLGVGEKERQTLEPLLITVGTPRPLVTGKLVALVISGLIGTLAFLSGMLLAVRMVPALAPAGPLLPSGSRLLTLALVALVLVMLLASVELLVSLRARSARQAQALFLPVLLFVSGSAYLAVLSDLWQMPDWYWLVPPANLGLILKATLLGRSPDLPMVAAIAQNMLLSWALAEAAVRTLGSERVLRRD